MEKQLPKNWVETTLELISNILTGKKDANHATDNGLYPFYTCAAEQLKSPDYSFDGESLIFPGNGANVGLVFYYNGKFQAYQRTYVVNKIDINAKYLLYHCLWNWNEINKTEQFGTATNYIKLKNFTSYKVLVPPLAEQERIAEKLDALFGQLDSVRGAMSRIPTLLANLRQQILTHAVTGKLTEEWRQGKNLEEWKSERADECCIKVQSGGTPKGGNFSTVGIPFLKVYNIVQNKIDFEYQPQYVTNEIQNTQIKKSITYPGDVIMNIVGPPLNKIAIIPSTYPEWNLNQAITLFRTKDYLMKEYLYYFFCEGSSVNSLINETRGVVGQVNISLSQCRAFIIDVPPKSEQEEIVTRVQSLFEKLDSIEQRYQMLKTKLENLPQAILHKAFKGELVEQLPTDGNAIDLLREIELLKKSLKKK